MYQFDCNDWSGDILANNNIYLISMSSNSADVALYT